MKETDRLTSTKDISCFFLLLLWGSLLLSNQFIMRHRGPYVCSFNTGKMRKSICFRYCETQRGNHTCSGRRLGVVGVQGGLQTERRRGEAKAHKTETPFTMM